MLNIVICGVVVVISGYFDVIYGSVIEIVIFCILNKVVFKFGDCVNVIVVWVFYFSVVSDFYDNVFVNVENLFIYDGVNVMCDLFGCLFVVIDVDLLIVLVGVDFEVNLVLFCLLGLVQSLVLVIGNNDFDVVLNCIIGKENLGLVYQVEWSYNLGVFGYIWKIGMGGVLLNDIVIGIVVNWECIVISVKDIVGVLVLSKQLQRGCQVFFL